MCPAPASVMLMIPMSPSVSLLHALMCLPPIHKDTVGPGSGASSLSLAALTSMFSAGTGSIIHCTGNTPVSLMNLPDNQAPEKMSLLPWWCQVMDFMFASGVQVKTWGSHWRWPSQLSHLYHSCVQTYRLPWGSLKLGSGAQVSMSELFVCFGLLLCIL